MLQLVFLGISVFNITDRTLDLLHVGGDAFVTLAAYADWPFDRGAGANAGLERRAGLRQVAGEHERSAGAVSAIHHGDVVRRQFHAWIDSRDFRRIPFGDLAQVDVSQHRAGQLDLARSNAIQVNDRHHAAHDRRELRQVVSIQVFHLQGHVGSAEIHGFRLDLLDAAAGADRLIVQAVAGRGFVGFSPFGVDRIRKRSAGAGDFRCHDRRNRQCRTHCQDGGFNEVIQSHLLLPC
jgi:hypothetical protein